MRHGPAPDARHQRPPLDVWGVAGAAALPDAVLPGCRAHKRSRNQSMPPLTAGYRRLAARSSLLFNRSCRSISLKDSVQTFGGGWGRRVGMRRPHAGVVPCHAPSSAAGFRPSCECFRPGGDRPRNRLPKAASPARPPREPIKGIASYGHLEGENGRRGETAPGVSGQGAHGEISLE